MISPHNDAPLIMTATFHDSHLYIRKSMESYYILVCVLSSFFLKKFMLLKNMVYYDSIDFLI